MENIFFVIGVMFAIGCIFSPIYRYLDDVNCKLGYIQEQLREICNNNNRNNEHFEKLKYRLDCFLQEFQANVKKNKNQ